MTHHMCSFFHPDFSSIYGFGLERDVTFHFVKRQAPLRKETPKEEIFLTKDEIILTKDEISSLKDSAQESDRLSLINDIPSIKDESSAPKSESASQKIDSSSRKSDSSSSKSERESERPSLPVLRECLEISCPFSSTDSPYQVHPLSLFPSLSLYLTLTSYIFIAFAPLKYV